MTIHSGLWPMTRTGAIAPLCAPKRSIGLAERAMKHVERWGQPTVDRYIALQLAMARMEGLTFDEAAVVVGVTSKRLIAWVRQEETIPSAKSERILAIVELLNDLRQLIEPEDIGRWFHLPIPALRDRTPLQAIQDNNWRSVRNIARSYTDPSFG